MEKTKKLFSFMKIFTYKYVQETFNKNLIHFKNKFVFEMYFIEFFNQLIFVKNQNGIILGI